MDVRAQQRVNINRKKEGRMLFKVSYGNDLDVGSLVHFFPFSQEGCNFKLN